MPITSAYDDLIAGAEMRAMRRTEYRDLEISTGKQGRLAPKLGKAAA